MQREKLLPLPVKESLVALMCYTSCLAAASLLSYVWFYVFDCKSQDLLWCSEKGPEGIELYQTRLCSTVDRAFVCVGLFLKEKYFQVSL